MDNRFNYISIGNTNAIRWKSQYYDVESGLYYIDGRYYSPEKREYLDPLPAEEVFARATTPGVDVFALTLTNPLEVGFVSYTADSFQEMSYDPETMTDWEYFWKVKWNGFWDSWSNFWNSPVGKALSISLFVVALVMTILASFVPCVGVGAWVMFATMFGIGGAFFLAGAAISGLQSALAGGSFWEAVGSYITNNWSETLAITSVTYIVTFLVSLASSPKCFKEGTLVETEEGLKAIEDIQVGDKVLAYDEETGVQAYKPVVQLFRNQTEEWYHIFANGEEIICTGGHPFYVAEVNKFIAARELEVGTKLLLSTGACAIIEAIQTEQLTTPETTYNFEVADLHTYYVGENCVLVHNVCGQNLNSTNDLSFESPERLNNHFAKHGQEFGGLYRSANEYLNGANYVIKNGTYVSQMNGYVKFIGVGGKANYAFVGLSNSGRYITTFGVRSVSSLSKIPWLIP